MICYELLTRKSFWGQVLSSRQQQSNPTTIADYLKDQKNFQDFDSKVFSLIENPRGILETLFPLLRISERYIFACQRERSCVDA
jgi:hypothetical protein